MPFLPHLRSRLLRGAVAATLAALALAFAFGCSRAGTGVGAAPSSPAPTVAAVSGTLTGVSCTSSTCVAVGSYGRTSVGTVPVAEATRPLAEFWDGSHWRAQQPPVPPEAAVAMTVLQSTLTSVSCTSPSACSAIGSYTKGHGKVPFAETWDGTTWTVHPIAQPTDATSTELHRVSCTSPTACTAVGSWTRRPDAVLSSTEPGAEPLAERWDGRAWTLDDVPAPTDSRGSHLDGLACPAPTACTAVGTALDADPAVTSEHAFATAWDGNHWTTQQLDEPAGASSTLLTALSCTTAPWCTAIGFAVTGTNVAALTETTDGTSWHTLNPTAPTGSGATLTDISCGGATDCVGVGSTTATTGIRPAAEILDATARTNRPPLAPPGAQRAYFTGVSCAGPAHCMAVGEAVPSTTVAMTQQWDGRRWTLEPVPMPTAA
ncbi:hypothetical protein ACIG5E_28455 [Kitasatospora sp. NPDC053057]|uniref:hypothetical protein n=1 Tax=Kitasatospora sp. NPDC053057 TaxID=3364062 RepID=UPI0037C9186B